MNRLELISFDCYGTLDKLVDSIKLVAARDSVTKQLKRELPFADRIYQSPIKTFRGVGYISHLIQKSEIEAFVTKFNDKVQGVATVLRLSWDKNMPTDRPRAEISYWIRQQKTSDISIDIGTSIVSHLLDKIIDMDVQPWMVTLPDDDIKAEVCGAVGMLQNGDPKLYNLDDGVTVERQLWVK